MRTPDLRTPASSGTATETPALARCVDPVAPSAFLADHWERLPLIVPRGGRSSFDDLISEADLERLVCSGALRNPAFRLVKAGERLRLRDHAVDIPWRPTAFSGVADAGAVSAAFADGATIVAQGLHHWWPPIARFCRALESELGHPAQANAYWTPRDSQGLPVHHDTHDVFVLQVAGEKRWLVYEPVLELPLKDQRYTEELGGPGEVVHDVVLRAGDTMYLPRGWLHQAMTSKVDSLHLTVGVNLYTWIEALRAALKAAENELELRRSVPADGEGGQELVELLAERLEPESVVRRMRRKFVDGRRPILENRIQELRALEDLTTDSLVERRPTVIADLRPRRDGGIRLAFEGKRVAFPARARAEVERLADADEPVRLSDLPGELDDEGRLVLARRLVREGFLRLVE
jgi:ribosomal protein L16 Arg81 hydroxylase